MLLGFDLAWKKGRCLGTVSGLWCGALVFAAVASSTACGTKTSTPPGGGEAPGAGGASNAGGSTSAGVSGSPAGVSGSVSSAGTTGQAGTPASSGGSPGSSGASNQAGTAGVATAGGSGGAPQGAGGTSSSAGSTGSGGRSGTLRIMPLGDSITQATCYRASLWQLLNQSFPSRFDFVGGVSSDAGCSPANYDKDNEGHSGSLVTNIVNNVVVPAGAPTLNDLRTSFAAHPADVVLMHFGTNDVWNNVAPQTILNAYSTMIDALRVANPNVVVLVAQIIAMNPINTTACPTCACPACSGRVTTLDGMIPAWAATKTTAASPVRVVDQLTGFNTATDTADGVHPNSTTGAPKIAAKWYAALAPLF